MKKTTIKEKAPSAGLLFLRTAIDSMPKGIGDREYSAAMGEIMRIAVRCRMAFGRDEGPALEMLNFHTCVGVFRALDYYTEGVRHGGTYAAMWEKHVGTAPWKVQHRACDDKPGRIAPGLAFYVRGQDNDPDLAKTGHGQVWWCTSLDDDSITICRYASKRALDRSGSPARRKTLDRKAWAEFQPELAKQEALQEEPAAAAA